MRYLSGLICDLQRKLSSKYLKATWTDARPKVVGSKEVRKRIRRKWRTLTVYIKKYRFSYGRGPMVTTTGKPEAPELE